jgi:DNA-binding NarL/FixJ family response regulator
MITEHDPKELLPRLTVVHRDKGVREFVCKAALALRWQFEAHERVDIELPVLAATLCDDGPLSPPHIVLIELHPPGICGLEWCRRLTATPPPARVVLVGEQNDAAAGWSALCAGASSFLLQPLQESELLSAVRSAESGQRFLPQTVLTASVDDLSPPRPVRSCSSLTATQLKVLWAMGRHGGEKGAALSLNMAIKTVHTHANHIYKQLDVHNLESALQKAFGKHGCPYACARRERERSGRAYAKA